MRMIFSAKTDTGKVRKENQDSYGISEGRNLYFLCDGMGGGAAGDFASRYASDMILRSFESLKKEEVGQVVGRAPVVLEPELQTMIAAVRLANRALSNLASDYPALFGMGTTVTSVYFDPRLNVLHIFHVGDSRVYRVRKGVLELLTKDHSKINELIDQGKMKEEEAKTAEIQSMITRALGTAPKVRIDYRPEHVKRDDLFMLCTDGLNGEIDDNAIKNIMLLNNNNTDALVTSLINAANRAGGRDNTTVIVLNAYDDKPGEQGAHDYRPGQVVTIDEETPEETKSEDRILKKLMSETKVQIPKSARDKKFMGNPLILGAVLTAMVALFGLFIPKCAADHSSDKRLADLAGQATGLKIDVREPAPDQYRIFKRTEDTITKLQIIQDWYRDSRRYTLPLKDVSLSISDGKREQFKGMTADTPLEIKLERGTFSIRLIHQGYQLITERMEKKDNVTVTIEPSSNYTSIMLVMIPQQ